VGHLGLKPLFSWSKRCPSKRDSFCDLGHPRNPELADVSQVSRTVPRCWDTLGQQEPIGRKYPQHTPNREIVISSTLEKSFPPVDQTTTHIHGNANSAGRSLRGLKTDFEILFFGILITWSEKFIDTPTWPIEKHGTGGSRRK
jgi:hypothetical protein